jgi:hypothetical protein
MTITVNEDRPELYVDVAVPVAYFGPAFLNISRKNLRGGLQKSFLMQFRYPSMQPRTQGKEEAEDRMPTAYAAVTTTVPGSVRKTASRQIENWTEEEFGEVCGIRKYLYRVSNTKKIIYYHKSKPIYGDIFFRCMIKDKNEYTPDKCRVYLETEKQLAITLSGVPGDMICEWREISDKVRRLANSFVVEENEK